MRIVFMGTPEFALPALNSLLNSPHRIVLVVTQPDKPRGRHQRLEAPPVKKAAVAAGLPVIQPERLSEEAVKEALTAARPDVVAVVAYGKIIPRWFLELPRYGCVNAHASLLPKYRGAAPIQRAIMEGERLTGLTLIKMDAGLDTGDVLVQEEIGIEDDDTAGSLASRMAERAAELLPTILEKVARGEIDPRKQDHSLATLASKIEKEKAEIDWTQPADVIRNKVRALNPVPGAHTEYKGSLLKVWRVELQPAGLAQEPAGVSPGTVLALGKRLGLSVATGSQPLLLSEVQPAGSKRMSGAEYIRGHAPATGDRFVTGDPAAR